LLESRPAKIRTLVVDDEPLARSNITVLLRLDPEIEIVGECGSGIEALSEIRNRKPELLFLDVQMPECDGFDVLEIAGSDLPAAVVFVTAYDQYALRAFEAGALDYLLKPFDNARFERALVRAKERLVGSPGTRKMDRLAIKSAGQVLFLKIADIDWIEAEDYYACLHVGSKTHLLRRTLSDLERELDENSFCRIHRSAIVNLDRVSRLKLSEDGEYQVQLEGGTTLRMSRRYRRPLQSRLGMRTSGLLYCDPNHMPK
jgi:two-component system LytT family response regulator